MGDVKRYDLELSDNRCDCGNARSIDETECEHGDYVRHSDHVVYLNEMKLERDAARSELAALREELSNEITLRRNHAARIHELSDQTKDLQQRLTAAEQRNATLVELLREAFEAGDFDVFGIDLAERLKAALKPTESGASV